MSQARRRVLIATTNRGKLREIAAVMSDLPVEWVGLPDLPAIEEPVEDGQTFAENARLKARYYAQATGMWTLADDSGLEVDALAGRPGIHSARYAGEPGDDLANNAKMVGELAGVPPDERTARFRCAIVLAAPDAVLAEAEGKIEGVIIDPPRGQNGFGYDPHFLVPSLGKTTAEIDPAQKNSISHRGNALRAIRPALEACLAGQS